MTRHAPPSNAIAVTVPRAMPMLGRGTANDASTRDPCRRKHRSAAQCCILTLQHLASDGARSAALISRKPKNP